MCEEEVASLGLIVAGEAAFHGRRGGGFAVYANAILRMIATQWRITSTTTNGRARLSVEHRGPRGRVSAPLSRLLAFVQTVWRWPKTLDYLRDEFGQLPHSRP